MPNSSIEKFGDYGYSLFFLAVFVTFYLLPWVTNPSRKGVKD